ncbi:MAG: hypothetical protein ABIG85_08100 [Chloroflexota bacterium]
MRIQAKMYDDSTPVLDQQDRELVPLGRHVFEVVSCEAKPLDATPDKPATWKLWLKVKVVESKDSEAIGKTALDFWNVPTEKSGEYVRKLWKTVGTVAPGVVGPDGLDTERLPGLRYKAEVVRNESKRDGKLYHNLEWPDPIGYNAPAMPAATAADLGPVKGS